MHHLYISDNHPSPPHLPYSPTDSFFISNQRQTSGLEQLEMNLLLQSNTSIPYDQSLPAYLISRQFIKSMGHLLDWSSVVKDDSVVYNAIIKPDASLSVQTDYLVNATRLIQTRTHSHYLNIRSQYTLINTLS